MFKYVGHENEGTGHQTADRLYWLLNEFSQLVHLELCESRVDEYASWALTVTKNEISLYIVTTCSNSQVTRIQKVITKDEMSWYLDKFSLLVP